MKHLDEPPKSEPSVETFAWRKWFDRIYKSFKTTGLRDVSTTEPTTEGSILVWNNTTKQYEPSNKAYGEIYTSGIVSITVTVSATSTPYEVTSGFIEGHVFRTSMGGSHNITVQDEGHFYVDWSLSLTTSAGGDKVEGGVMINGAVQTNAAAHANVAASNNVNEISAMGIFDLVPGDEISLYVENHTGIRDIVIEHANLVARKLVN